MYIELRIGWSVECLESLDEEASRFFCFSFRTRPRLWDLTKHNNLTREHLDQTSKNITCRQNHWRCTGLGLFFIEHVEENVCNSRIVENCWLGVQNCFSDEHSDQDICSTVV